MKALNKMKAIGLSLLLTGAILTGCKKDDVSDVSGTSSTQGYRPIRGTHNMQVPSLTIRVINTKPNDSYKEVNVSINRIDVLYEKSDPIGWLTVSRMPRMIDLMHLQNTLLLDQEKLFMGHIVKLRLFLGTQNSIVTTVNGNRAWFELKVPVMYQSGVEVPVNITMMNSQAGVLILDFQANTSVSNEGDGTYILNPVIKPKRTSEPPTGPVGIE